MQLQQEQKVAQHLQERLASLDATIHWDRDKVSGRLSPCTPPWARRGLLGAQPPLCPGGRAGRVVSHKAPAQRPQRVCVCECRGVGWITSALLPGPSPPLPPARFHAPLARAGPGAPGRSFSLLPGSLVSEVPDGARLGRWRWATPGTLGAAPGGAFLACPLSKCPGRGGAPDGGLKGSFTSFPKPLLSDRELEGSTRPATNTPPPACTNQP